MHSIVSIIGVRLSSAVTILLSLTDNSQSTKKPPTRIDTVQHTAFKIFTYLIFTVFFQLATTVIPLFNQVEQYNKEPKFILVYALSAYESYVMSPVYMKLM